MNSSFIISQTKLNVLQERVCSPIKYLCSKIDSATPLWDGPVKMCQQIEDDRFAVDTVVMEAKKRDGFFNGINAPRLYHAILCRVYIILYYLHHDDPSFQEIVFRRLKKNMGVYNDVHLKNINEQIDEILAQEELLKKLREEEKKPVKPVFAYVTHNRNEMDHLYIEYSEEELFRGMSGVIRNLAKEYGTNQDEANVWYNAKLVVKTLRSIPRPELLIERAAIALVEGQMYNGYEGSQIILLCAYAMICSSKNNEYFDAFIKKMEDMSSAPTDLQTIQRSVRYVKKWVDEHPVTDGNDYIGEPSEPNETYSSADIERIRKQIVEQESAERKKLQQDISVLKQENSELKTWKEKLELQVQELTKENERLHNSSSPDDEMTIELLTHLFYKDETEAKKFFDYAKGKEDGEITEKVKELKDQNKISSKSYKRDLWRIMHASKLYSSTEENWNHYFRTH
jgi:hypothetical protein